MEWSSALKWNEALPHATTWMIPRNTGSCSVKEVTQRPHVDSLDGCDISRAGKSIETEADSGCQGRGGGWGAGRVESEGLMGPGLTLG